MAGEPLDALQRALAALRGKGPRYRNHLPPEFPLDAVIEACAALDELCLALAGGEAERENALVILQLEQSRLFGSADHLPARQDHEPLDGAAEPSVNAFRNLFTDVVTDLGRVIEQFPRPERDAARPTEFRPPVDRDTVRAEVKGLIAQAKHTMALVQRLEAKIAPEIKLASDNTVQVGLFNIGKVEVNLRLGLGAFARLLGDKWIKVDWVARLHGSLRRGARALIAAIEATRSALADIARTIKEEIGSLLQQSRRFLARYVEVPENGPTVPAEPKSQDGADSLPVPEMVTIPTGTFLMGTPHKASTRDEALFKRHGGTEEEWAGLVRGYGSERPYHVVRIDNPMAVGRYPVTFEEYDRFTEATGREPPHNEGWGRGRRPVINVSWNDATAYCRWLSARTGRAYRLPSEAEWEYACRAGTMTNFSWGNRASSETDTKFLDDVRKTTVVGSYPPNGWGIYDMHGNVGEWTQDVWNDGYVGAPVDGSAWQKGPDISIRVLRGGSGSIGPRVVRAAHRYTYAIVSRFDPFGFRVARTLAS